MNKKKKKNKKKKNKKKRNKKKRKKKKRKNKAVYTAASVACFWAGAVTLLTTYEAETALSYRFG